MNPVTTASGTAYPWGAQNVDTDVIIPATRSGTASSVVLPQEAIDRLLATAIDAEVTVDLEPMTVTTAYQDRFPFELDPFRRRCLMEGLDEVGLTLAQDTRISNFEGAASEARPWVEGRRRYEGIAVAGSGRT